MTALHLLQEEIRACRRCVEAGYLAEARPLTQGHPDAPLMIIGQAPSRIGYETRGMYRGPAGQRMRGWFLEAGFVPEDFGTRVYFAAVTKCFPGRLPGSSKDRVPSPAEQRLCRPWLDRELALVRPRVIVLFGGLSIRTFLSKDPLADLVGRSFEREGVHYIPLPHSSGASTWLNRPEHRALLQEGIDLLREARRQFL